MPPLRLGFIGIGLMGAPMTRRLLDAGFPVTVWNRSPEKTGDVAAAGARVAGSIGELVADVDVIMLCLANTRAVESAVFGDDGVAAHARGDQWLIDFSSSDPQATRTFARRLSESCATPWVDAPVSGGVAGAESGSLAIMCGGEAEHMTALQAVFAPLAARVTHMGPVGSGQVAKLCNQMIVGCNALVIAEMIALAEASGVDAGRLPEALAGGFADSKPLQLLAPRMAADDFDAPPWHLRTLLKDLDMALAQSQRVTSAAPMTGLAGQLMRQHAAQGHAEDDPATLVLRYRPNENR
ncbi:MULTISPECIES: NAD(P)-dependent oxidoreductase [unclassified Modicisalibacter]|uniref:NAD(P)-dependent oxidoreductase n=1 Tax=unclassified Modicisalibacter TaxID=2679913 RepID=UPI001CC91F0C|nr:MULTISPECIES: NAD(P)-dependent oxidoreductase [unclassified Modicisalibacter]MBZ9556627.1 NAD(P)-dependent oxidoreductase [Modicisalibacter sp. R2A 31.J]MBZ9574904.1 NAD(P)-dependent oxidoreductase [Modicisalibacter sp. MOD 31.J]